MITIPFKNKGAFLYVEIYEFIKQEITAGGLKYGEKLPSKRSLASHLATLRPFPKEVNLFARLTPIY